jgi:hypothetical protein
VNLIRAVSLFALLFVSTINAGYIYEANQSLIDLTGESNTTNMGVGDDQVSSAFNLDFTFTFYGEDFTSARMATNGCLHFGSSGGYCNDYTPDPLPEITYTLYPFWTDLIRDNGSKVLAKNFTDKSVFGWYNLREYNRSNTDNSFEVILWKSNDSFEFRYGALNIINHDVLIGEQGASDELYTYLFYDQCGKGTTNVAGTCVNVTWNASPSNTLLENGGSLYGVGSGNSIDCSNPLNNTACTGYDAAYLTQQCDLDGLYSTQCPNYWDDLFHYECSLDSQYSPTCAGYMVETFVEDTYYQDDMFGYDDYQDDQYGYYDPYEEEIYFFEEDPVYITELQGVEFYEEELYFEETLFFEEEYFDPYIEEFNLIVEEELIPLSYIEEEIYIENIYEEIIPIEEIFVINYDLPRLNDVLLDHFEYEEHIEEYIEEEVIEYLEFETIEELEEWIEQEDSEEILEELADLSEEEAGDLDDSQTVEQEVQDREEDIELVVAENEEKKDNKKAEQLNVVANTIRAASNSVSGTTAGTSAQATGTSISSGGSYASSVASGGVSNPTSTAVASLASGGGISTSNSPSISAQVASSAMQTQQVLSSFNADSSVGSTMVSQNTAVGDTNSGSNTAVGSTTTTTTETNTSSSVANNTSSGSTGVSDTIVDSNTSVSQSDADVIADQIVAQNIEDQQEQLEQQQQETGEYADESQLIAYMGYVQGFNGYTQIEIPELAVWYEPEDIYANVVIPDNNNAFMSLYRDNLNSSNQLISMQPNL